jgi:hypothetical protein
LDELRRENEDNKAKAADEVLAVRMDLEKMKVGAVARVIASPNVDIS